MSDDPLLRSSSKRLEVIIDTLQRDDQLNQHDLPGLANLLADIVDPKTDVPREDSVRRLLQVFWKSETDGTYSEILDNYEQTEIDQIRAFVEDGKPAAELAEGFHMGASLGARDQLPLIPPVGSITSNNVTGQDSLVAVEDSAAMAIESLKNAALGFSVPSEVKLYDDQGEKNEILVYVDKEFANWGRTVQNTPHLTYVPRTSYGIQQIVKYAKEKQMNVRASGYRHSWSPIFGKNGQIIISTLGLTKATMLPNMESLPGSQYFDKTTELNSIDFVGKPEKGKKRLVRVGTAVTNQKLRRWCSDQKLDAASTLPLNVIMVEITLGGSNAPICHGAGRKNPSLSDLVHGIEYVDANGNMQAITKDKDPEFLKVAGGCFGLLGIVTHLILEFDPMSYAVMLPQKLPVMEAIPPPPGMPDSKIPKPLFIKMTPQERADAQAKFEQHAKSDYYAEWFWFPYTSKVWVNCWNNTDDGKGATEYPSNTEVFMQWVETVLAQILQVSEASLHLQDTFPWWQTTLLSKYGLYALPDITDPKKAIKTQLPNALHFRRAIQNVRVRDIELEIPLQPKTGLLKDAKFSDDINWILVQQAWWDAIIAAYDHDKVCPQRMPLEMRITGPSSITMAPFRGNNLGTCSIEVLTLENTGDTWIPYIQDVLNRWMELKDNQGNYLDSRPHWAKEWYDLQVRGKPMVEYLKETYKDAIAEFRDIYGQIAKQQNWSVEDARERFNNDTLNQLFFE